MRVILSAGEQSGDVLAGELAKKLRHHLPEIDISGIGGKHLAEAGAKILADSSTWGAIGLVQSLRIVPRALAGQRKLKRHLATGKTGLFIPIDFGFMNIHLAKFAKARGWKVLYLNPPGSWRRDRQGADLPKCTDAIVTPFKWSAEILQKMGGNAYWFGHPIKELVSAGRTSSAVRETVAMLPGSRRGEIESLAPILAQTLADIKRPCEVAVATNIDPTWLNEQWRSPAFHPALCFDGASKVLGRARAGVICSGTATLEAALCRCPQVVIYRVGFSALIEARILGIRPKFISQPNILLDREVVPELVQGDVNPANIRRHLEPLLEESSARTAQLAAYDEIFEMLGPEDAISRTAELASQMIVG